MSDLRESSEALVDSLDGLIECSEGLLSALKLMMPFMPDQVRASAQINAAELNRHIQRVSYRRGEVIKALGDS